MNEEERENRINIIFLIADAGFSGGPMQLLNLVENLDSKRFSSVIISPEGFLSERLSQKGIKHYEYDFKRRRFLFGKRRIKKIIAKALTGRDVIHCQGVRAGHFGRSINKKLNFPLIYTEHNWTKDYKLAAGWRKALQLRMLRKFSKYTSHTVAVSQAVQNFLVSNNIVTPEKVSVIYNGVKFNNVSRREDWDPIVLGTIASLNKRKGLVYLLDAVAKSKAKNEKKVILKVVGSGPQEAFLKQHSVGLGINFEIQWLGEREELEDFWSSINIYVQPSLDESFGMAVVEAMGYKIPVISTTVGALPEIVEENGLLVEPENSEQIEKAIENIVNNETLRKENVDRAYRKVKKNFTVEKMVEQYERLYERIMTNDKAQMTTGNLNPQ